MLETWLELESLVLVLSVQSFFSSAMSPNTTNVVRRAMLWGPLHEEDSRPGHANVSSTLLGERFGMAMDKWVCRWNWVLAALAIVLTMVQVVVKHTASFLGAGVLYTLLAIAVALCSRVSVLKSCADKPTTYYWGFSIISRGITATFIRGPPFWTVDDRTDAPRAGVYCWFAMATGVLYTVILPTTDSMPARIIPRRVRI